VDEVDLQLPKDQPDLFIHVDCGDPERVDDDFKAQGFTVNIDHHLSNTLYATLNWVDTEAASAAEMIYRLAVAMDLPITPEAATALYTGVMTDTGGFRYTNTDSVTLAVAGHLVECGANPARIAGAVYESRKPQSVRLIGEVYASLKYEFGGQFVWNEITQSLYGTVGGDEFEPDGLASDIRGIDGVEVSALFHETEEGHCRVGLRSKGRVNVSALAQTLGGGGHHNASGAYMRGDYAERREWALGVIREHLAKSL
jgi:phosphoesterase RecJ-like protein